VNTSTGYKVFDSDLHLIEPPDVFTKYVDAKYSDKVPVGAGDMILTSQDGKVWGRGELMPPRPLPNGYQVRPGWSKTSPGQKEFFDIYREKQWSNVAQLEAMEAEGIDVAVLFPTRSLFALSVPDLDPGLSAAIARAYNDWLYDFMDADRTRMLGAAMITPFDVDAAITETRRAVKEMGFKSVFMRANLVAPHNWHDPYYDPLWAEIADLGIPMTFHEASGSAGVQVGDRLADNLMLSHVLSHPLDQMISVVSFCCGGILERHPDLRVAFLEGNCSWVPFLLWRMDEHVEWLGDTLGRELTIQPSDYFRRQCYVSIEADEDPAWATVKEGLTDRLVFSTDFPHPDSKYPASVDRLLKLEISDEAKKMILWDNCATLYGVE
jgi:predicted TIM-barrel fold metal-dependent hydrolase